MRLGSGRRVAFGRDADVTTAVPEAVAASCAIPGYFVPVRIGEFRYVDGGVHSPTNADVLAGQGLDLVIVSSAMSAAREAACSYRDPIRALAGAALTRELPLLRARGTRVVMFAPTTPVLACNGAPEEALDPRRRAEVAGAARIAARRRAQQI